MVIESGDRVSLEYVGRLQDGTVFDTSRAEIAEAAGLAEGRSEESFDPITVEIGNERIIEGFEEGLLGLEVGASETITVPPEKGYGERTEDKIVEYDRDELEEALGDHPREQMHIQTTDGGVGEITEVGDDHVEIDFNHELAGETIEFEVEILDIEA